MSEKPQPTVEINGLPVPVALIVKAFDVWEAEGWVGLSSEDYNRVPGLVEAVGLDRETTAEEVDAAVAEWAAAIEGRKSTA